MQNNKTGSKIQSQKNSQPQNSKSTNFLNQMFQNFKFLKFNVQLKIKIFSLNF